MFKNLTKKQKGLIIIVAIAAVLGIITYFMNSYNPGGARTVESFYADNTEERSQLMNEIKGYSTDIINADAELSENTLIMNYTYVSQLSDKEVAEKSESFEAGVKDLQEAARKLIKKLSSRSHINRNRITITLNYLNKDGSLIWTHDFGYDY